jgi:hypothetical protein
MTDVMEDTSGSAVRPAAAPPPMPAAPVPDRPYFIYTGGRADRHRAYPADHIYEEVTDTNEIPTSYSRHFATWAYYYADDTDDGHARIVGLLSGRPIDYYPRGSVEPSAAPADGDPLGRGLIGFNSAIQRLGAGASWSGGRTAMVLYALHLHFLPALTRREYANEDQAVEGGFNAVATVWSGWDGVRSRGAGERVFRDTYRRVSNGEWTPPAEFALATEIDELPATHGWTSTYKGIFYAILRRMMTQKTSGSANYEDQAAQVSGYKAAREALGFTYEISLTPNMVSDRNALLARLFPPGPVTVPADIAAMSEDEVKQEFTRYRKRTERTIELVHDEADRQGMCSTFDSIMLKVGWPKRAERFVADYTVEAKMPVDVKQLKRDYGITLEVTGSAEMIRSWKFSTYIRSSEGTPSPEDAVGLIPPETIQDALRPYEVTPESPGYTVKVTKVRKA